jgi:hypothetical protein
VSAARQSIDKKIEILVGLGANLWPGADAAGVTGKWLGAVDARYAKTDRLSGACKTVRPLGPC